MVDVGDDGGWLIDDREIGRWLRLPLADLAKREDEQVERQASIIG
jgi:hypothetical protein